jgi:hypothetical protein
MSNENCMQKTDVPDVGQLYTDVPLSDDRSAHLPIIERTWSRPAGSGSEVRIGDFGEQPPDCNVEEISWSRPIAVVR